MKSVFPDYFESELKEKIEATLLFLQEHRPSSTESPLWVGFSGGKDSIVLKDIIRKSKVRAELHYSLTTIDPPELVKFIQQVHSEVIWDRPKKPFMVAMSERGLPMRPHGRWCCQEYKESGPNSTSKCRLVALGIRWAESNDRKKRLKEEQCYRVKTKRMIHPIIEWSDGEIWAYIRKNEIPYCSLYDEGFKRLGCVGCPFASQENRDREFARWPKFAKVYRIFIRRLWERNKEKEWAKRFNDGDDLATAWMTKINPFPPKTLRELQEADEKNGQNWLFQG